MLENLKNKCWHYWTKFSFGATSGIMTNLGIIAGLDTLTHPKTSIIGAILVIAIADNISDSMDIHIYKESECSTNREVCFSTLTNFLARLVVSLVFIVFVALLPIKLAVLCSLAWGLGLLAIMSYTSAKERGANTYLAVFEHIIIALVVVITSKFAGQWIIHKFS
jgi:hypothetical protein